MLYDDPIGGYPKSYARDDIPRLERYPGGQTLPSPKIIDFKPGQLLGSVSGELGLRKFLEEQGHTLVVTSHKDGPDSVLESARIMPIFRPPSSTVSRLPKSPTATASAYPSTW